MEDRFQTEKRDQLRASKKIESAKDLDITGQTFGRLTAIRRVDTELNNEDELWKFSCSCGGPPVTYSSAVVMRNKAPRRSCGCLRREHARRQGELKRLPVGEQFLLHINLENRPMPTVCRGFGRCLTWIGCGDSNGRAQVQVEGRSRRASHAAWFLTHGVWPEKGTWLCHACDDVSCVNPLHLIEGGPELNGYDRYVKRRGGILLSCYPITPNADTEAEEVLHSFVRFLQAESRAWREARTRKAVSDSFLKAA